MKKLLRSPLIYILIIAAIVIIAQASYGGAFKNAGDSTEINYKQFLELVRDEKISAVQVTAPHTLTALKKGSKYSKDTITERYDYSVYVPSIAQFEADALSAVGVESVTELPFDLQYNEEPEQSVFLAMLPYLLPSLAIIIFIVIMSKNMKSGGGAMSFGKSRAKMTLNPTSKKTFADVAGADEEKEELEEIVEFLKRPQSFIELGARIPKGVLLVGPPGGGKTLLAKAVAGEAGVPFFSISGSDFVEMFVGVGASRVRDLFDNAKKNAPCIVFIDEIDAVGRQRGAGLGGGHDEREQTLNQLLVEMDGFQVNEGIIVMAATNRKDILDPALLRAGRFDRQIVVNYPDVKGREEILRVHAKGKPLAENVDLAVLAKRTPGFIGADLENVLNEAAILTARHKKKKIGMTEIEEAITRVIAGPEKKSRVVTEKDKRCTAYHEVGHAIVAYALPDCDPVHEISIIPRGMAAGYTLTLPEKDDQHMFKSKLLATITMMLGGRAAEAIILGDISTGASNDIQRATEVARGMVAKYGMSELIGPVFHGGDEEVFLGKEFGHTKSYSEAVGTQIDAEIKRIMTECYENAKRIINENMDKMHEVTAILIDNEKIEGADFEKIMNGTYVAPVASIDDADDADDADDTPEKSALAPEETEKAPEAVSEAPEELPPTETEEK